ncbi:hypothetical protein K469DRAFT_522308, partial [Zopfia rhizophila CBS 207.26]
LPLTTADELTASAIPSECTTICEPIVQLTNMCDTDQEHGESRKSQIDMGKRIRIRIAQMEGMDMKMDSDESLEADCVCNNKSFDVKSVIGLCESCMRMNAGTGNKIAVQGVMSQCSFPATSYAPSATSLVQGITVQATKPTTS